MHNGDHHGQNAVPRDITTIEYLRSGQIGVGVTPAVAWAHPQDGDRAHD